MTSDQHQEQTDTNLVELLWDLNDYEEYEKSRANKAFINFFVIFLIIKFNWSVVDLKYCVSFRCTE